jgi:sensor histidine kinase YesM/ligand-binding sensor domain-containing protein
MICSIANVDIFVESELMKTIAKYLFIFLLLHITSDARQSYFRNYSVENGLPFIQVNSTFQDSKGYLWIGGYGGLSRFDGNVFENYSPKNGLVNYCVNAINEDNQHHIWIGTINGLSEFDGDKFINHKLDKSARNSEANNINDLIFSNKKLWIATKRGLFYHEKSKFNKIANSDFVINSLCEINSNQILVGSDIGLLRYDCKSNKLDFISGCAEITDIIEHEKCFYITTLNGLYIFDGKIVSRSEQKEFRYTKLNSGVSLNHAIYFASDSGIFKYVGNTITHYRISENFNSNLVSCISKDDEQNIWLGTYLGLFRYRSDDFISYLKEDGLNSNFIFQILKTKNNELLVTTGGSGMYIQRRNKFINYTTKDGLIDNYIWSACKDKSDNIWLGTNEGLSVYDGRNFKSYTIENGLLNNYCITTFCSNKGEIWIGNKGGISHYVNGKFETYKIDAYPDCDVSVIYRTRKGELLLGAYQGGLFKLVNNVLVNYGKQIGINSESVMALEEDSKGNIYIGTFDGLYILKEKKLIYIDTKSGLSSDLIYQLKIDNQEKYLWIGTNQSLNRMNLKLFHEKAEISVYRIGKYDGFSGVECNTGAVLLEGDSAMWFGTVNGLYKFNIVNFIENIQPSKTVINSVKVNYESISFYKLNAFASDQNNITFSFTGICFTNPEKVLYTIKLEGYDKIWRPASSVNIANYLNLPPGNYTFKVKSCNNEGVWNQTPATYTFTISPPWYKTILFRILAISALLLSIYLFLQNRAKNIRESERRKLENEIAVASNKIKALRSQMNPHFIFNSLNSIQHFVVSNNSEKASKYLNKFSRLIRMILSHSEKQIITLSEEIELLQLYLELEQVRFESKFSYEIEVDKSIDIDFIEVPTMLIQPFVENAVLHGIGPMVSGGFLKISFLKNDKSIVCVIDDNGIGREKSMSKKNADQQLNLSLATKNTEERINLLKKIDDKEYSFAIFDKHTMNKTGTRVEITFPY